MDRIDITTPRRRDGWHIISPLPVHAVAVRDRSGPPFLRTCANVDAPPIDGGCSVHFVRFGYRRTRRREAIAGRIAQLAAWPDLPRAPPSA